MTAKECEESMNAFVANLQIMQGHVKGETSLPLPPERDLMELDAENDALKAKKISDSDQGAPWAGHEAAGIAGAASLNKLCHVRVV